MKIDTEGTYTLRYTAEDECGNVTTEDRTVNAINITYSTVLFADGTFIINEKGTDRDANIALHGAVTNEYDPLNPNGATDIEKYIFNSADARPWRSVSRSVNAVEIGAPIAPIATAFWFNDFRNCTSIDLHNLDTSETTTMRSMFGLCRALPSLDLSRFRTSNVTDMTDMFNQCFVLSPIDVSTFDTSAVTSMNNMFRSCQTAPMLDISSFDTTNVVTMNAMFEGCQAMQTIYVSQNFVVDQVTDSSGMFGGYGMTLVGGAGTVWSSTNANDATYAHIDGGTADPGYFTAKP